MHCYSWSKHDWLEKDICFSKNKLIWNHKSNFRNAHYTHTCFWYLTWQRNAIYRTSWDDFVQHNWIINSIYGANLVLRKLIVLISTHHLIYSLKNYPGLTNNHKYTLKQDKHNMTSPLMTHITKFNKCCSFNFKLQTGKMETLMSITPFRNKPLPLQPNWSDKCNIQSPFKHYHIKTIFQS